MVFDSRWPVKVFCVIMAVPVWATCGWGAEPSLDELLASIRTQPPAFAPRTEAELAAAKAELETALGSLDTRLEQEGPGGEEWSQYLGLDTLQQQLSRPEGPDLKALDAIYAKFSAGHEGLGLIWFKHVRVALRRYVATARAIGLPRIESQYAAVMKALPDQLEAYRRSPSPDRAVPVRTALQWLRDAGQAPAVIEAVRQHWGCPNFHGLVSDRMASALVSRAVDDNSPVNDYILGTTIQGTGHTTGDVTAHFEPASDHAEMRLVFSGTTDTTTTGYNRSVRVFSTGTTQMTTQKTLLLDAHGFAGRPAASQAALSNRINGIRAGRSGSLMEGIAWRLALRQKPQADAIAARHAEQQANQRTDTEASDLVSQWNGDFQTRFCQPLVDRDLFPEPLRFETVTGWLSVTAREAGPLDLAAPSVPADWTGQPDMAVQIHETALNNLAEAVFGGMTMSESRMRELMVEWFGELPERFRPSTKEDEEQPLSVTFARRLPVMVAFADGGYTLSVRGQSYRQGGGVYPGMNVTARYKIRQAEDQWKAVRQGDLEIFPPGFDLNSGRTFSVREQALRTLLKRRFERLFEPEIVPGPMEIEKDTGEIVRLNLIRWESGEGWLRMAWEIAS